MSWKIAAPPLLMVLVFTPPAIAITRELTARAESQLRDGLAIRAEQMKSVMLENEFVLLEAVRLATNIQGIPDAVRRSDEAGVRSAMSSIFALKEGLDLLVMSDARGRSLSEIRRTGAKRSVKHGADWIGQSPMRGVLRGTARRDKSAGIVHLRDRGLLAVAGQVRDGDEVVGASLAGIDAQGILGEAARRTEASMAFYDLSGARLAEEGSLTIARPPVAGDLGTIGRGKISGEDAAVLYFDATAGGERVGTLAVGLPRSFAFALADSITRKLEILIGLAIAAGLMLLVVLTRFVLAEISHLVHVTKEYREGRLDARATVVTTSELGEVAEGFNAMAEELQASYSKLEKRVADRTRQLRRARDAAEKANQVKTAFLANMSHEIRTPMNAIMGFASVLLESGLDEKQNECADTIRRSSEHLLMIINDVLDLSKVESGGLELEQEPFSLRTCLDETVDLVAMWAEEKHVGLTYQIAAGTPEAFVGDSGRIRQVLLNLLSNAVKFTDQGEITVSVEGRALRGERYELHFTVCDTGIGIDPEKAENLFLPFTQADVSTTRLYGGTGLGLAISKLLVDLMDGQIWVESAVGRGSTFHFIAIVGEADDSLAKDVPAARDEIGVLIVSRSGPRRKALAGHVLAAEIQPTAVATVEQAVELLGSSSGPTFGVCVLDADRSDLSSAQLGDRIRAAAHTLPLILVSSTAAKSRAGRRFAAVLTEPFERSEFVKAVTRALPGRGSTGLAAPSASDLDHGLAARHPLRILVAEDSTVNQKVMGALLLELGYTAEFASNGSEAIAAVASRPYDVVFMDVQMPQMDGLQASRELTKRGPRSLRPRIVALTARATVADRRECAKAGMDDYLSKPVTPRALVEALERCSVVDFETADAPRRPRVAAG